jgi:hypothetical protein
MHSSYKLTLDMFDVWIEGQPAAFYDLMPGFSAQDRLGIVARTPLDALWASGLIMATITAFYDEQRRLSAKFFIYPDYFVIHAGCAPGDYGMLDIWPDHKVFSVEDTPEAILRAVNDRAITRLALPVREPRLLDVERQTRNSALARLRSAFLYGPAMVVDHADVWIEGNAIVEGYVDQAIHATLSLTDAERAVVREQRAEARASRRMRERLRRLTPEEALRYL